MLLDCSHENKQTLKPSDVADLMGLSVPTVRKLFLDEPGVIVIDRPSTNSKKRYRSLRIPRAVFERVMRRVSVR